MSAWYPLAARVDNLEEVNSKLRERQFELVEYVLSSTETLLSTELHQDTIDTVNGSLDRLRARLDKNQPKRKPDYALVCLDDCHDWTFIY